MRVICTGLALLSLTVSWLAEAQTPAPVNVPRSDAAALFGVRESIHSLGISPDGRSIVYTSPGPGRADVAFVQSLEPGARPRIVLRTTGNPDRLRWCDFVTNDRLICQVTLVTRSVEDVLIPFSRLISVGTDGGDVQQLGQRASFYDARIRQFDAEILDWLPGQDGSVLMAREYVPEVGRTGSRLGREEEGLGVDRVNVATLRITRQERANERAAGFISDGRGHVRIMSVLPERGGTGQLANRVEYFYRAGGSSEWRPFSVVQGRTGLTPLAVDAELDAAYVLKDLDGRYALYRVKLDGTMAEELIYANERVDVDDVVRANRGGRVIGVTFAEERREIVYFDPAYAALHQALGRAVPNLPLIDFVSASLDDQTLIIHAGSDSDPGRYFVYERAGRRLNEIMLARPQLEHVPLANVRAMTYAAADGTEIPAYLTLPPGSDGRNLPAVILPHGGPSARDEWGFDWLPQYLAHRGYAVLQPNYRGSAGYGSAWLRQNGFQGWRTSIGDVTAGARWLASEGIADPARLAIVGWSYGGYAALQAGVVEPGLFRAIVAIAPVTDLQQLKDDQRGYTSALNVADYIGTGPHIREGSPLRNAAALTAPVLLFHGDMDLNVRSIHSARMDRALREAGRQSELVLYPGLAHDLGDSNVRTDMLERIGRFLDTGTGR